MKAPVITGAALAAIAALALALAGCGGEPASAPAATSPATAPTSTVHADVIVPPTGAAQSLTVNVGDTFTVWLNVSPRQAKAKLPVVGWARDEDDASALTSEGPAQTVPQGKGGLQTQFQFTVTTSGTADMGFRQATEVKSGITPLARTAVVHLTVN